MPVSKNRKAHKQKAAAFKKKTTEIKNKQAKELRAMIDEMIKKQQGITEQPSAEVVQ